MVRVSIIIFLYDLYCSDIFVALLSVIKVLIGCNLLGYGSGFDPFVCKCDS